MATAYYQNVDELWSKFKQGMSALLQTAYQLPEDLQMKATMEMEETLFIWKKSLKQSQPSTDQLPGNVSPDENYSLSSAVTVALEPLVSEPLSLSSEPLVSKPLSLSSETLVSEPLSLSSEPLVSKPLSLSSETLVIEPLSLSSEPLADSPQVKISECKPTANSDSEDEELVIAITDVALLDSGSSDDDTALLEDTVVSAGSPCGTASLSGQKTAKRKYSPRKCKSDLGTRSDEQPGADRGNKVKEDGEDVGDTVQPRKRGRPRKGVAMRPKQRGGTYSYRKQTCRKIAPKPDVNLEFDNEMTVVTDIPKRKRGRPKKSGSSNEGKIWTHKCDMCGKLMATKTSLAAHIRVHTGEKPYQCEECGKSFSQISGLSVHRKRHRGTKDYHCQYCGFAAIQSIDISRHEMRHHTKEKPYLCDLCGRGFIDVWSLKNHINTHSKHKKDYVCDKCDFKTHSPDILRAHTRNMHQANRKMFKCPICDLVLRYQDTFSGHMRRHYGEKPFACKVCEASFASNSQLAAHKRIHQERLFACTKCNKKFINPHKLRRHEVVHTGAKEFKCPVCTYMCNVKSNLKKHCTAVHKIEYPPPDMKRIKIVPFGTKDNSDAADLGKIVGNSGSGEAAATSGSECADCKIVPNQQVRYLEQSKAANGVGTTGHVLDQQQIASKLHTGNASLVANNNDAGNFLLFINECGTSDSQHNSSRSVVPLQQSLVVMPSNPQVTEQTNINVESDEVQAYADDNVCELRFEQV